MFFCKFYEIFKKIFFAEDLRTTAFGFLKYFWNINHFTRILNNHFLCIWLSFSSLMLCGARERKGCKHDSRKRINFRLCPMFVFYIRLMLYSISIIPALAPLIKIFNFNASLRVSKCYSLLIY